MVSVSCILTSYNCIMILIGCSESLQSSQSDAEESQYSQLVHVIGKGLAM